MRRIPFLLAIALAGACGSSEKPPPPLFGGFASVDATAVLSPINDCTLPVVGSTVASGVALVFSDVSGACGFATDTVDLCGGKANASLVVALAVDGQVGGTAAPPLATGFYPYLATPPTGFFKAALGTAARYDGSCSVLQSLDMVGGSITLSSLSPTLVAGSVDLHFEDGSVYQATFDVNVCPVTLDLCALVSPLGCVSPTCVP